MTSLDRFFEGIGRVGMALEGDQQGLARFAQLDAQRAEQARLRQSAIAALQTPQGQQMVAQNPFLAQIAEASPESALELLIKQQAANMAQAKASQDREALALQIAGLDIPNAQNLAALAAAGVDVSGILTEQFKAPKAESNIAKLARDYQAGIIPKEVYDAALAKETAPTKEQKEIESKKEGAANLENSLAKVMQTYQELDAAKAIPSTQRGGLENVGASIAASGVGQMINRARGTPEQAKRDFVKNARTLILQDIKNATGMSAQQMNSNVELQTFLQSLGDPSQSIETIRDTIANMSAKFGTGELEKQLSSGATPPPISSRPLAAQRRAIINRKTGQVLVLQDGKWVPE